MAKAKFLNTLQAVEVELLALNKTLSALEITDTLAVNCQYILENAVFVKALVEVKSALDEYNRHGLDKCNELDLETEEESTSKLEHPRDKPSDLQEKQTEPNTEIAQSAPSMHDGPRTNEGRHVVDKNSTTPEANNPVLGKELKPSDNRNKTKKHQCSSCGKTFADTYSLKIHIRTHTHEKPFECEQCGKCFHGLPLLHQHEKIHSGPYLCTTCGKQFATKTEVQTHGYTHTGERPFSCDKCDKSFRSKQSVNVHIKTVHVEEKRWKCEECAFETKFLSHFRLHQKRTHGSGSTTCEQCGLQFTSFNKLTLHKLEHRPDGNPYTCKQCRKGFVNKKLFDAHMRTHTNERPFKCSFCSDSFKTTYACSSHELIHKGLKPHKCEICEKSFTQRSTMKKHVKNVHNKQQESSQPEILTSSSEPCTAATNANNSSTVLQLSYSQLNEHSSTLQNTVQPLQQRQANIQSNNTQLVLPLSTSNPQQSRHSNSVTCIDTGMLHVPLSHIESVNYTRQQSMSANITEGDLITRSLLQSYISPIIPTVNQQEHSFLSDIMSDSEIQLCAPNSTVSDNDTSNNLSVPNAEANTDITQLINSNQVTLRQLMQQ